MLSQPELENLQEEFRDLQNKLSDPKYLSNPAEYQKIAKRYGELKGKLAKASADQEKAESRNEAIIEIRPGAGGDESSLFAQELFKMYTRYAEKRGWKAQVLSSHRTDAGGLKEMILEISGKGVMQDLALESGVHRVQRIPATEKAGRIHTSTVSVAVLPKAEPLDIEIKNEDLKIDTYRASGPGGQHVNKTSSAVRITHTPSGIIVASQDGRHQQENKDIAMTILRTRLLKMKEDEEARKMGDMRKQQIGSADRSEKIRTYNFPQDRITDHRIKESWGNIEGVMDGNIEDIVQSLKEKIA